jgi:hypothetical protein
MCGASSYSSVTDDLLMTSMIGEGTNKQDEAASVSIRLRYLSIFNRVAARLNRSPLQRFLFAIFCLSVFLHLSEKNLRNSCHLPEEAYFSSTILFGGLTSSLAFAGTFLCAVLGAILYRKRRWSDCNSHRSFRFLIIASAATLTWAASTYSFNYYFDQAHNFDRVSIALLCLGLMRWPSLVGLFVVYAFAILSQFDQPFGGFSWTDKDLPLRVMLLFGASLWLSITARRRELMRVSLLMTFSLIASHYFVPGWGKLISGWQFYGNLHYLFAAGHINGWLDISSLELTEFFGGTQRLEPWLIVATLALECGAIAVLTNRHLSMALLLGWAGLHVGIFAFSGICFWKWVIVDLAAVMMLVSMRGREIQWLFHGMRPWAAVLLVAFGQPVFKSHELSWFDTPLTHTYRFVGIDSTGERHGIAKYQMAPYDFFLCQNRLWFLPQSQLLTRTWSSTKKPELAFSLLQCQTLSQLGRIEPAEIIVRPDLNRQKGFERWLRTYFRNMAKHDVAATRGLTGFPQHIWTTSQHSDLPLTADLTAIEVFRTSSWCHGDAIHIIEDIALMRVGLSKDADPTPEYFCNFSDEFLSEGLRDRPLAMVSDLPMMESPPFVDETGKLMVKGEATFVAETPTTKIFK